MARTTARVAACAFAASLVVWLSACAATSPSVPPTTPRSSPLGPPVPGSVEPTGSVAASGLPVASASSALPTTVIGPTPGATENADVWTYLADFPASGASEVTAVTGTADGFVAVGFEPAAGEDFFGLRQGVVWRSADGRSWERSVDPAFANATLLEVAALDERLYVFGLLSACGQMEEDCADIPEAGMTVWRSDPAGWQRMAQSPTMRDALLDGVVAGRGQIIAFGSAGDDLSATVWLSTDGTAWEDVTELAGMDPVSAMTAGPEGFVAFGTRYIAVSDTIETVAAFSADGRTFEPAALPAGLDSVIKSIAHGPAGFVAVGNDDEPAGFGLSAAALVSADGRTWRQADADATFTGAGFNHVSALPDRYLAVGFVPSGVQGEREEARSWVSAEGQRWQALAPLAGAEYRQFNGAASGPAGVAVFALDYLDDSDDQAISTIRAWFAPLEMLVAR